MQHLPPPHTKPVLPIGLRVVVIEHLPASRMRVRRFDARRGQPDGEAFVIEPVPAAESGDFDTATPGAMATVAWREAR